MTHAILLSFTALSLLLAILACGYYVFLGLAWLLRHRVGFEADSDTGHRFTILIPAHDEESTLPDTLRSCAALDYPRDRFEIVVIADNCTDRTAAVAVLNGATCLERNDGTRRGKGFALEWAIGQVLDRDIDAVVVLDADCQIDAHALRAFSRRLARGERVVQACFVTSNPDASPISYLLAVGNALENTLFYAPKSDLGLAVFLRGTGMVLHREILERHPWRARSIVEDVEYTLELLQAGIRITFADEVRVSSEFPVDGEQLRVQRVRHASGNITIGKAEALKLLGEGLTRARLDLADAGWTLLVLSRPLVLLQVLVTLLLSVLCVRVAPGLLSAGMLITGLGVAITHGLYIASGVVLVGIDLRRLALLARTPVVLLRLVWISLLGLAGVDKDVWARTPRKRAVTEH